MLNRIKGLCLALLFLLSKGINAQIKPLGIGDQLPDLSFENVFNYTMPGLNLSDFKGKAVILDFWNHKCLPCIAALPKLDSIQKLFMKDLQIVLVNRESRDSTIQFFKKRKNLKIPALPFITGDLVLHALFKTASYPSTIWIDKKGTIRYMSGEYNVTPEHIREFLEDKNLDLHNTAQKTEFGSAIETNSKDFRFVYYSAISHCNRGINIGSPTGEVVDSGRAIRLASNCNSILNLLKRAFEENGKFNFAASYALDIAVKDTFRIKSPKDKNQRDQWMESHAYNYEVLVPLPRKEDRFKIMQEDLQKSFNIQAYVEYRMVNSIVLKVSKADKLPTGKGEPIDDLHKLREGKANVGILRFNNKPFELLADYLRIWFNYDYPFFNEGDVKHNISITVREKSVDPLNLELLQEDLGQYGLDLVLEKRRIPVLVIRDK